ncbi:hypothetical protein [Fibrella aquatica]|uniref:hypothetical protein n=1 Tax=Fibrella aquatica TaxID=3242487 RepID=UPI003521F42B
MIIPFFTFVFLLVRYSQNIPATDDFVATLQFIYSYLYTDTSDSQHIRLIFSQHNEHRIVISRLLTVAFHALTGEVNLAHFLFVDALFLAGLLSVLVIIYRSISPSLSWYHYLLPFLLLLSPHSYETFLFISGGSQSYPVLFFTALSIWLLHRASLPKSVGWSGLFGLSVLAAGLATFSFGSGFLVWAGGAAFLFFKRRNSWLFIWGLMAFLAISYYFIDFYRPSNNLAMTDPFGTQLIAFLKGVLLFPGAAFIVHWPNFTVVSIQVVVCYLIGLVSWGYVAYLLISGYGRQNPLLFSLLGISLAVGVLLSLSRIGVGSGFLFTSRYMVFTSMTPILLYAIALDQRLRLVRNASWLPIGAFLLFVGSLWTNLPFIEAIYEKRQAGFAEWQRTGKLTLYIEDDKQAEADKTLRQVIQKGLFRPNEALPSE